MKNIEIVSASAGSGKTYKLAEVLEEAIASGDARPEAIVATTFTNKAAAELAERVRKRLLERGRMADADRLAAARIGTVNSVCGRLVSECAFELGLPPRMRVLDENQTKQALDKAMSGVITQAEEEEIAELAYRMGGLDWRTLAKEIMEKSRSNDIAPSALADMAGRSAEGLLANLSRPVADGQLLDKELQSAIERFISDLDGAKDKPDKATDAREEAIKALMRLRNGKRLPWRDWASLTRLNVASRTKASKALDLAIAEPLRIAASAHDRHPDLRHDLEQAITMVFSVAARGLERYQAYKRQWAVLDFVDQEVLALKLLGMESVRTRLAAGMDLVLVDEFQDTSPIQIAIFLKLADIAKRCVWVGDQKQSIYGFRGTDPALMDAAIGHILGNREPETLSKSWRSRPELVRLTSDLFVPPFAKYGMPESRVRLEPACEEPAGMGPIVEYWRLNATKQTDDAAALASAVQAFLQDPHSKVRDQSGGGVRQVESKDVAVLCRTNDNCAAVARALTSIGVPAVIPQNGLVSRAEAQAAITGLRLWADPYDRLARGQLARIFHYPDKSDLWLAAAVESAGEAFQDLDEVKAVQARRSNSPNAGPVSALDAVCAALKLRERCLQWGDYEQRLANLDALRAHAVKYAENCAATGSGSTPAGLVAHFEGLAADKKDKQALLTGSNAVVVSTWHGAKGLEWQVVVLYDLGTRNWGSALGVAVEGDPKGIDMNSPLASRWVRCWLSPYGQLSAGIPFLDLVARHDASITAKALESRQELRLLYVGWTRAKDCVVLAARKGKMAGGTLAMLKDGERPLLIEPAEAGVEWAGHKLSITIRDATPSDPVEIQVKPGAGFVPGGPKDHPAATVSPSDLKVEAQVKKVEHVAERVQLKGKCDDEASLGDAVHGFLAADRPELERAERLSMAEGLLTRFGAAKALDAKDLLGISESLKTWVKSRWPKAELICEPHMAMRMPGGTVMRGIADLVVSFDGQFALVDHKSFPGNEEEALKRATTYGGQLAAYAECFSKATGKKHVGSFIYLPISGLIVELGKQGGVE